MKSLSFNYNHNDYIFEYNENDKSESWCIDEIVINNELCITQFCG